MTAPRPREQADPPSPPDRLPSPRGGFPPGLQYRIAGERARPSGRGVLRRTAAALLVVLAAGVAFAPAAPAQDVTALQATMTVGFNELQLVGPFVRQRLGYHADDSYGVMNPSSFPVAGAPYTVRRLFVHKEGNPPVPTSLRFGVRGAVTSTDGSLNGTYILPKGADITLHLEGTDWSKSYSLQNANRTIPANQDGDVIREDYTWTSDLPPLTEGEQVTVRLIHPPAPPPPANLRASPGDREVALSWDAPASGSGVTRHEYRYKTTGSYPATWTPIPDSARGGANEVGFTVTRLTNGTAYTFELRAVGAAAAGAAAVAGPVTPALPAVVPTSCTLTPGDVWCGTVTVGRVAANNGTTFGHGFHESWHGDGVGGLPDGIIVYGANSYRIDEATVGVEGGDIPAGLLFFGLNRAFSDADRARLVLHVGSARFPLSDAHFESSTHTYHWRKTGLDWSSTSSVTLRLQANLPSAPTAVTAIAPARTGGLLEVRWSAPASAQSITGYEVKYWRAADPENRRSRTKQTESTKTSFLLYPFLDADTEYKLRVRARDTIGRGAWSEVATARTGAKQPGKPIVSLAVVDANGADIDQIAEGGTFRYRVKVTNLRNHHQSSGSDFTGWGTLGVRGPFAIDYIYRDGGKAGCYGRMLFLKDFTWTSATTGYWEFDSADIPADAAGNGPLRLRMGFACTPKYAGASHEADTNDDGVNDTLVESGESDGAVTTTSDIFTLGSPDRACLSVADSGGTVTHECAAREAGARALKARFVSPPARHDGSGRVKVRVAFSEAIEESPETVGEHGVQVEGGRVTGVRQEGNRPSGGAGARSAGRSGGGQEDGEQVWEFEIDPSSAEDLTVRIDAGRPCDEAGAICTADGRSLSEGISTTVEGPDSGPPPLTAAFQGVPESHDGEDAFRFRVAFSEDISISYKTMRDHSFTVSGGEVTKAKRVNRRKDLWEIKVEPETDGAVTIALPAERACGVSGAICTRGANRRRLTNTPTATVVGPAVEPAVVPLTASFAQAPAEHDGASPFKVRIAFSEAIKMLGWQFRAYAVAAAGGRVTEAKRVDRRKDLWEVTVRPRSYGDVALALAPGPACGETGAVCTPDGRALSAAVSTRVPGPAAVSVADARVDEAADAVLDFAVTLSRATSGTVAVAYATADGSATAGSDYTATAGTLTFAPGETAKTVTVPVLDDAHDEGEETLTLRLTAATGAVIADGEATGTIKNTDHLQRAWLARFGRTAATHVTDAVGDRLRGTPGQGSHLTVGGYRLPLGQRGATDGADDGVSGVERLVLALGQRLGLGTGTAPAGAGGVAGAGGWPDAPVATDPRLGQSRTLDVGNAVNLRQVLLGSSFRLAFGRDDAGASSLRLTAWGRVAGTTFDGRDGTLSLNGDVLTGTVGVDGEWDRLLAGLAVAHSRGDGSFTKPGTADRGRGELESTLTSVHPYLRYAVTDRLAVWGLLGYGTGQMEMELDTGETRETDMDLVMGAFGGRGILLAAAESGGFQLATRTDAMLTRTTSDAVQTADGNMASGDAEAHRLRLVLEGSRGFAWAEGRRLTPTMEVGLRHDWGDAETGFGLELGGRVHYADPALGLTIDAAVRGLLAHEDSDYQEWGASGTVRLDPGAGGQGLALTLAPAWGAASSGVNGLWSRQTTAGLAPQGNRAAPASRLNAEVGYGFAPFGTGLLTPYAGTVLSEGAARTYRVGGRLQMTGGWATGLTLNLEGTRQDPAGRQPLNQGLRLQVTWGF